MSSSGGSTATLASKNAVRFSRNQPQPTAVAATPPTVGALSGAYYGAPGSTSSIANAVNVNIFADGTGASPTANPKFTVLGWPYYRRFDGIGQAASGITPLQLSGFPGGVEFLYYGTKLELVFWGDAGGYYRVWADGQPLTAAGVATGVSDGANHNLPVTFAAAGLHVIRLQTTHGSAFAGVNIGPTDTVRPSPLGGGPQLLTLSDSYGDGANGVATLDTWPNQLADLLGVKDYWLDAQGGTGIVNTGGIAGKNAYLARLVGAAALPRLQPNVVLLQGSTNDATQSGVQGATTALIAAARAAWPSAFVVVTGLILPTGVANIANNNLANNAAVKAAAQASRTGADLFIDAIADGWYSGTGRVGSATGVGNSDIFMSNDQVHPSAAGHAYIAACVEQYLASALALTSR